MGRKPKRPIKTGLEPLFDARTLSVYGGMKSRFGERRDGAGRVVRVARELPFSLYEFRAWVRQKFGGSPDRVAPCAYCRGWVDIKSFVVDHNIPIALGGKLGLENCELCCGECNRIKGLMTGKAFVKFRTWVIRNMTTAEVNDIFGRMKQGGEMKRVYHERRQQEAPPVEANTMALFT